MNEPPYFSIDPKWTTKSEVPDRNDGPQYASSAPAPTLYDLCEELECLLADARTLGLSEYAGPGDAQPSERVAAAVEALLDDVRTPTGGRPMSTWRALQVAVREARKKVVDRPDTP